MHPSDTQVGAYIWDYNLLNWRKLTQADLVKILEYTVAITYNSEDKVEYYGESEPGTSKASVGWRIRKYTYDANGRVTDIKWADGSNDFSFIWNNYSSYSYS